MCLFCLILPAHLIVIIDAFRSVLGVSTRVSDLRGGNTSTCSTFDYRISHPLSPLSCISAASQLRFLKPSRRASKHRSRIRYNQSSFPRQPRNLHCITNLYSVLPTPWISFPTQKLLWNPESRYHSEVLYGRTYPPSSPKALSRALPLQLDEFIRPGGAHCSLGYRPN